MSDKKLIAVVGATGAQGGGLADAVLADPDGPFTVRALTRRTDSAPAAAELGNMFQYYAEAAKDFTGARDVEYVRTLYPGLRTFRQWLDAHRGTLLAA